MKAVFVLALTIAAARKDEPGVERAG